MADHAFGAKRGRGVAGVACEPPVRRAGGLADDDEKDGGTAEPDGELGLRIDDALLGRIGRGVPCERGGEAVGDVDGRDEVAQRLVVSHDGRKRVHLREERACTCGECKDGDAATHGGRPEAGGRHVGRGGSEDGRKACGQSEQERACGEIG